MKLGLAPEDWCSAIYKRCRYVSLPPPEGETVRRYQLRDERKGRSVQNSQTLTLTGCELLNLSKGYSGRGSPPQYSQPVFRSQSDRSQSDSAKMDIGQSINPKISNLESSIWILRSNLAPPHLLDHVRYSDIWIISKKVCQVCRVCRSKFHHLDISY